MAHKPHAMEGHHVENMLAFQSVTPHLKYLRRVGFYQIDTNSTKMNRYLHRIYMTFILSLNLFFMAQEFIYIYQVRADAEKVVNTMFLMIAYTDCLFKQIVLRIKQDNIEEILNLLKGKHFNQDAPDHQNLLIKQEKHSKLLLRAVNIAALATCLMWAVFPVIIHAQGQHVEFIIWLPFDPNTIPQFYIALVYVWAQSSLLAVGTMSTDAFVSSFFAQSKTQLKIIRYNLENIVKKCQMEAKSMSVPLATVFHRRFHDILLHYDEIVLLCNKTQSIFGGPIFYFFLIGSWIICTSAFRMFSSESDSLDFISMILYIICILSEIFLYCYYGNEVAYESDKLMKSAFAMDWYEIPLKQRYPIIIFMERIKRPIIPIAGSIIPLSNTTFVSIIRSSYSFYALLKNADDANTSQNK